MQVIEFLSNAFIGLLVAYLGFTNSLAVQIESLFQDEKEEYVTTTSTSTPQVTYSSMPHTESSSTVSFGEQVSRILLDHRDFQRAALLAQNTNDPSTTVADSRTPEELVRNALVNIFCQYKTDTYTRTTTGTGVFIHEKGIILTNAHVAQFLLLKDGTKAIDSIVCTVRTGDPAVATYTAELLYLSPTWIAKNSTVITEASPQGTGERDYALLYISRSLDSTPLPTHFPAIPFDVALVSKGIIGTTVVTAGYPAEILIREGADAQISPVLAETTVEKLYTFGSQYADVVAISDSDVGEHGASGGPIVVPESKNMIGLIVTKGDAVLEGERSLRAITLSYIDRTIKEETGYSLEENIRGDVAFRGNLFQNIMVPFLSQILEESLSKSDAVTAEN